MSYCNYDKFDDDGYFIAAIAYNRIYDCLFKWKKIEKIEKWLIIIRKNNKCKIKFFYNSIKKCFGILVDV